MKIFELKNKQVINEEDCCIIGCVIDIDFDPKNGCMSYLSDVSNLLGVTLSLSMSALINIKKNANIYI